MWLYVVFYQLPSSLHVVNFSTRVAQESPKVGGRWAKEGGGGMTEEEAIAAQQRMFAEARARMNSAGAPAPSAQANDSS